MYKYRATQVAARLLRAYPTCPEELVERTIDQLRGWINQEDLPEGIRISSVEALGSSCKKQAIQPLIHALSDKEWWVRDAAVQALGKIRIPLAVDALIQALTNSDSQVRCGAADVLGEIGSPLAIQPLVQALSDESDEVRRVAAKALGKIGDSRAVQPLIQALSDKNNHVRESAAGALGKIGNPRAVPHLIQALSYDEDYGMRGYAAEALGKIGDSRAVQPLIQALSDEVSDKFGFVRRCAAEALGKIGSPLAAQPLIQALCDNQNGPVRIVSVTVLGKISSPEVVQTFIQRLSDNMVGKRSGAAKALGKIGNPRAVPHLVRALSDENFFVRGVAAEALGKIGDSRAVQPLIQTLSDEHVWVRKTAATALGKIGEPTMPSLRQALKSSNNEQRSVVKGISWDIQEKVRYPDFYQTVHPDRVIEFEYLLNNLSAILRQLTPPANGILLPVSLKSLEGMLLERQRVDELYNKIFMEPDWDMNTTVDSIQSLAKTIYSQVKPLDQQLMIIFYELDPDDSLIRLVKHLVSRRVKIAWITDKPLPDLLMGFSLRWGEQKLLEDIQQWINNEK